MHPRGGRQFLRGGSGAGYNSGYRRKYQGHHYRSRGSPIRNMDKNDGYHSGPSSHQSQHRSEQHQQQQPQYQQQQQQHGYNSNNQVQQQRQHRDSLRHNDVEEIKELCFKLTSELEIVRQRVEEVANSIDQIKENQTSSIIHPSNALVSGDIANKRTKRAKAINKQRGSNRVVQAGPANQVEGTSNANDHPTNERDNRRRNLRRRQDTRDIKDKQDASNISRPSQSSAVRGDDSTTQAADPSSEEKVEGEDGPVNDRVKRVFRKKKHPFNRRRMHNRRRNDSSERNSNDTSPQNEMNGEDYRASNGKATNRRDRHSNGRKRSFPELSESEISELVQVMKRDFFSPELDAVKKTIDTNGPTVAQEFASSILDHAMCDVTSPTKLSEISNNFFQLIIGEKGGFEFQQGFYGALSTISGREDDIAIDAPRYMDTLGQILGECVAPMNTNRYRQMLKRFLNRCLVSYCQKSRAQLLASTMRGIARHKSDRFAKDIWDTANLKWSHFLTEGSDLEKFIESEDVVFTTKSFSPLPRRPKKTSEELEKFADDVTNLVEKRCTTQTLEELVRDMELDPDDQVDYIGTLVYAIVRGCLTTDSGDYKLDTEALGKFSSILNGKNQLMVLSQAPSVDAETKKQSTNKKENMDAIALRALTSLTKLWHQYNCPQNLMSTILLALHNHGAASYDALKLWLNSDDLKSVPGIGAARLNSKRCIEDLGASRG